jgi:hypothetical protein
MNVIEGNFGSIRLDGLRSAGVRLSGTAALRQRHGATDHRCDIHHASRNALLKILSGRHAEPGTIFNVFSLLTATHLDPVFAPIEFSFDLSKRRARIVAEGALMTKVEPIRNPVTGAEHQSG